MPDDGSHQDAASIEGGLFVGRFSQEKGVADLLAGDGSEFYGL